MKYTLIFCLAAFIVCSCSENEKHYILKVKLQTLDKDNMFDPALVGDVIFDAEEQNLDSLKNKSRLLFLKGIDLYKNKKSPEKAIGFFTSSILTFPEAKTYYELGNALMEVGGYDNLQNALKAYKVTRTLDFAPLSNVYYNEAVAHYQLFSKPFVLDELVTNKEEAKLEELSNSISSLREAFEAGYYDTTQLKTDKRIQGIIQNERFKEVFVYYTAKRLKGDAVGLYSLYLKSFQRIGNNFEVTLNNVELDNYTQSISYDFAPYIPEMENVSFGRSVSNDFYYVARMTETPNYTAIIYKSSSFEGEDLQPVHSVLATYDNKGEIISKVMLSCVCSASKVKTGKVEDGKVTIEEYKRNWKEPIDKVPFYENSVKSHDFVTKATYRIDETGKILEESVPEEFKDSTTTASELKSNEQKN